MYSQNEKFDQLETKLRAEKGQNQQQICQVMAKIEGQPLAQWFDILSGAFIVAASQGIKQATTDQLTRSKQKHDDDRIDQITNSLFKRFCDAAADPKQRIARYLNDDISNILERSANVKTWEAYVKSEHKQLLLAQLLYIWYLGWQRGYAFTVEIDMLVAKKQSNDPRFDKMGDAQIKAASTKISETESTRVLAEIFHDAQAQERIYLMVLAYLETGKK